MITRLLSMLTGVVAFGLLLPVHIYRAVFSPLKGVPSCRYLPTCSEYAVTAVKKRGIVVGSLMAVWRVLRCNPLFRGGYDPVPCRHSHRAQESH
jgi:putative membrane protein insertion efficiency factor